MIRKVEVEECDTTNAEGRDIVGHNKKRRPYGVGAVTQ
jgi:hypothetical protein